MLFNLIQSVTGWSSSPGSNMGTTTQAVNSTSTATMGSSNTQIQPSPWLNSLIESELISGSKTRFPMKLGQTTTLVINSSEGFKVNIDSMIGGKVMLSDGSLKVAAEVRNIQQALKSFNPTSRNFLNSLNSNMVLALQQFSMVIRCRENNIEFSLDVEKCRILQLGVKWPTKPKAFVLSTAFDKLRELALKGKNQSNSEVKSPAKTPAKGAAKNDIHNRQNTPEPQNAQPVAVISTPDRSCTRPVEQQQERLETPKRPPPAQESRSPLIEISPKTAQRHMAKIDINNPPMTRSIAVIPQNQALILQDKQNFLPNDAGKRSLVAAPLPFDVTEELFKNAERKEADGQLKDEQLNSSTASEVALATEAVVEPPSPSSSDEEVLDWELTPSQKLCDTANSLPPDTPTSTTFQARQINNRPVSSRPGSSLSNQPLAVPIGLVTEEVPMSTMGMIAEVPQALEPSPAPTVPGSSPTRATNIKVTISTPARNASLNARKFMTENGLSSPISSEPPSPTRVPSSNVPHIHEDCTALTNITLVDNQMSTGSTPSKSSLKRSAPASESASVLKKARSMGSLQHQNDHTEIHSGRSSFGPTSGQQPPFQTKASPRPRPPFKPISRTSTPHSHQSSRSNHGPSLHHQHPSIAKRPEFRPISATASHTSLRPTLPLSPLSIFAQFQTTYPDYPGSFTVFFNVCAEQLLPLNLPRANFDDFIIRQLTEYPSWINRQYMNGKNGKSYQEWYMTEVRKVKFQEGLLSREAVEIIVREGESVIIQDREGNDEVGESMVDGFEVIDAD